MDLSFLAIYVKGVVDVARVRLSEYEKNLDSVVSFAHSKRTIIGDLALKMLMGG